MSHDNIKLLFYSDLITDYDGDNEHFDNLDKDMKMCVLAGTISKKEHYARFVNILNSSKVEEYINKLYKGETLLQHAYRYKNYLAFELLLNHPKIDLYIKNDPGDNILCTLIQGNDYKLFMLCIEKMDVTKIDTNVENKYNKNLLCLASENANHNFLKILLTLPCSHDLGRSLQCALKKGNIETFKVIYESLDITNDINIYLPLHRAIKGGIDMVKFVLNLNNIDFNIRDKYGRTAFYKACCITYSTDIIELFLKDDRIDVNLTSNYDITPFCAVYHDISYCRDKVKMILDYSKIRYIDLTKPDIDHKTLFHHTLMHTDIYLTKLLLEFDDDDIDYNSRDINGISPFYAACWNDKIRHKLYHNEDNRREEFKEHHKKTILLLLKDDRIDKSDINKVYQDVKDIFDINDDKVQYIIEILNDYLNKN